MTPFCVWMCDHDKATGGEQLEAVQFGSLGGVNIGDLCVWIVFVRYFFPCFMFMQHKPVQGLQMEISLWHIYIHECELFID